MHRKALLWLGALVLVLALVAVLARYSTHCTDRECIVLDRWTGEATYVQ